jgi:DNA-binding NtrC family response regulator
MRVFCRKTGRRIRGFTDDALEVLVGHDWPGNVRELKNAIERLVILSDRPELNLLDMVQHFQGRHAFSPGRIPASLRELRTAKSHLLKDGFGNLEKAFLIRALEEAKGNITHAAARVGMQRSNFSALMKKHRIKSPLPPFAKGG